MEKKFKERAEAILAAGAVGFGEMAAEHFPSSTPYEFAPPDHPLFLLLADIAAQHDVPICIHMEAVPQDMDLPAPLKSPPNPPRLHANIAAFERLLAHNPRAKIVWAHLGWDTTGYRTPELTRRLLEAHPNLFMEIKLDPLDTELKNSPLSNGASGTIKPEWLKLFTDFQDRFVIGSDRITRRAQDRSAGRRLCGSSISSLRRCGRKSGPKTRFVSITSSSGRPK